MTNFIDSPEASPLPAIPVLPAPPVPSWPISDVTIAIHDVTLESGVSLPRVDVHYRLEGTLNATRDNLVLVVHALTGTTVATAWWKRVVGAGHAIDPDRHAVLCANLLGGCDGTTGPSNSNPDALPPFTTRDQAMVLARVLDALGVQQPLLVCGGSLGGMVTMEFAASFPERTRAAVVLAAPAAQTAQGLAWNALMRRAIALGGVHDGLALARMMGMLSYRTPEGLERRFSRTRDAADRYKVNAWLHAHGDKLVARFNAASYGALIDAMDGHDVGRGRGGVAAALAPVADRLVGVGVPADLLYPALAIREWTTASGSSYVDLPSEHGHDAFLLETARVSQVISDAIVDAIARAHTVARVTRAIDRNRVTAVRELRPLRVALAGCGHVGGALLDLIGEHVGNGGGYGEIRVQRVLVRDAQRERPALTRAIARGITTDTACIAEPSQLLGDDIDVLVEVIGGTTTARSLVEHALDRSIRVVTANKALLGIHGSVLASLAAQRGVMLDYEGAVCGAIPVVRSLRSGAAGVGITRVDGILNGTSNYVLDRLAEGASLAEAVATAQELGYAEADPTRDLSGEDAEDKLRILAWLAFGVDPAALRVTRRGLDAETAAWVAQVAAQGDRVKLIASCSREGARFVAHIAPTRVSGSDAWAHVSGPRNRVVIESDTAGSLEFQGAGAGGRATAGAVLSDLLHRAR